MAQQGIMITPEMSSRLQEKTGFTVNDMNRLATRFQDITRKITTYAPAHNDTSRRPSIVKGVTVNESRISPRLLLEHMAEWRDNALYLLMAQNLVDRDTDDGLIDVEYFIFLAWILSSDCSVIEKLNGLWLSLDVYDQGWVGSADLYPLYSLMLSPPLNENQCLSLVRKVVQNFPDKKINKTDFISSISETELFARLTSDLLPSQTQT